VQHDVRRQDLENSTVRTDSQAPKPIAISELLDVEVVCAKLLIGPGRESP
jgi:hypothetical protein